MCQTILHKSLLKSYTLSYKYNQKLVHILKKMNSDELLVNKGQKTDASAKNIYIRKCKKI